MNTTTELITAKIRCQIDDINTTLADVSAEKIDAENADATLFYAVGVIKGLTEVLKLLSREEYAKIKPLIKSAHKATYNYMQQYHA